MERRKAVLGSAAAVIITAVIAAIMLMSQGGPITVNEFFNDLVDRNGDRIIMQEDAPCDWKSYEIGDNVTIRDRISYVQYNAPWNYTVGDDDTVYTSDANTVILINYTGKYEIRYEMLQSRIEFFLDGDQRDRYHAGDYITVNVTIYERLGQNGETYWYSMAEL